MADSEAEANPYRAPASEVAEADVGFEELPRLSTWWVLLFTTVSLFLFGLFWLYRCSVAINRVMPHEPLPSLLYIGIPVFWMGTFAIELADLYFAWNLAADSVWSTLSVLSSLLIVVWGFSIRARLHGLFSDLQLPLHVSGMLTLLFTPYALSYKINQARALLQHRPGN